MKPYYEDSHVTIYHGDCTEVLPDVSGNLAVTSPPYNLMREHSGDGANSVHAGKPRKPHRAVRARRTAGGGMSEHTPGPWKVRAFEKGASVHGRSRAVCAIPRSAHRNRSTGRVERKRPDGEDLANARLIAAAPDLLDTLETIRDTTECARTRVLAATALEGA